MSEPIRVESMMHQGVKRIKVILPYEHDYIEKVKQVPGRRWSQSKKCWYVPYDKSSFEALKALFADVGILLPERKSLTPDKKQLEKGSPQALKKEQSLHINESRGEANHDQVKLIITPRKLFLQLKKQEADIRFIRNLRYARWNDRTYLWEVTYSEQNLQLLRHYFADRLSEQELSHPEELTAHQQKRYPGHELSIAVKGGRLRLMFAYDQGLITFIKQLPYPKYDAQNRWWSVADSPVVRADLEKFCQEHGWKLKYTQVSPKAGDTIKLPKREAVNYRKCPQAMLDQLTTKRYSNSTIRAHTSMFEEFISFYPQLRPEEITEKEILVFLRYLVEERQVSTSYQNQSGTRSPSTLLNSTTSRCWVAAESSIS